jgi:hypothetical protein
MKKTALCIACFSSILFFSTNLVHAVEKIVFNTGSMKYESGTGAERCREKCGRRSDPDVKSFLSEGWVIVGSSAKEVIAEQYLYSPCPTCKPHGCVCLGTAYILRKDVPAPKNEIGSSVYDAPDKDNRPVLHSPTLETSMSELDHLTKENDLLRQENTLLKQEIETLRKQLRSKQK